VRAVQMLASMLFITLLAPSSQATPARTDFSGTWTLDLARSDFGPVPKPQKRVDVITQTPRALKIHRTVVLPDGEHASDITLDLGGAETAYQAVGGELRSTAAWKGRVLMVTSKGAGRGGAVTLSENWTLSPDRKSITVKRHTAGPDNTFDQTMVMTREPAAVKK
jgi:hypothetical protein